MSHLFHLLRFICWFSKLIETTNFVGLKLGSPDASSLEYRGIVETSRLSVVTYVHTTATCQSILIIGAPPSNF